jgi:hypothetical protein
LRERKTRFGTSKSSTSASLSTSPSTLFSFSFLTDTLRDSRLPSEFEVIRLTGFGGSDVESSEFLRFFGFRPNAELMDASDECLDTTVGGGDRVKLGVGTCNMTAGN